MQQVAARNCLHGAASGARAGVSVLEELFWNAPARSVRFAASFALAACFLHGFCALSPRARDGLGSVACDTWPDAAMHCGKLCGSDPTRVLSTFGCFAARARLKLTSKVRVPLRQRCVFVQVCSDHVSGGRGVLSYRSARDRGTSGRGVHTGGGAWGCPGAVDANGTANILPPSPLQRRRRGASSEFIC